MKRLQRKGGRDYRGRDDGGKGGRDYRGREDGGKGGRDYRGREDGEKGGNTVQRLSALVTANCVNKT